MVHATISHELRNPLNSMIAQQIRCTKVLKKLKTLAENQTTGLMKSFSDIQTELLDSNEAQESST